MKKSGPTLTPLQTLWCLAKGLLVLVLLFWTPWAVLDQVAQYRLGRTFDDLQEAGFATCLEELSPPGVPPEENAAFFYSAAFAAYEFIDRAATVDYLSEDPTGRAELDKAIERSSEVISLVRRARGLPKCRFDHDYRMGAVLRTRELPSALHVSGMLSLHAERQAENGRQKEARETVRDLLALAERFREEPDFTLQLVRHTLVDRAVETIESCSRSGHGEADLVAWLELLHSPTVLDDALKRGLRADLAAAACLLTQRTKVKALTGKASDFDRVVDPLVTLLGRNTLERMSSAVGLCRLPYPEAALAAKSLNDPEGSWNFNLLRLLERPIPRLLGLQAIGKSRLALTRAGLEAELFFVRHGHYPRETTIVDEISGKPFTIDIGEGVIRASGPGTMDPERLKYENLIWTLLPR